MKKKYEFTGEVKEWCGKTLHQIRAVAAFGDVSVGGIGGWIEREENLSHNGNAWVCGNAWVYGNAQVCGNAWVYGNAQVCGNAWVCGDALVYGDARVCGDALVYGDARVCGNAQVCGNAWVCKQSHWLCIGPIGSRDGHTTFFRAEGEKIFVKCGCFLGDIDAFALKVRAVHGGSDHAKAYMAAVELAKIRIDLSGEEKSQGR